ncbi:MAG: hypothetical protein GVY13_02840 [Alphaproteobacteria bacterium]|jgi:hypothetical protein|nr:hypothetical protein [Alphaproteobacteria bacterium]
MADPAETSIPFEELVTEQPESADPDYLAWKRRKIEAALKDMDENPDDLLTEEEVWKHFGLDY